MCFYYIRLPKASRGPDLAQPVTATSWRIAVVTLSDSFATAVRELCASLGAEPIPWTPGRPEPVPAGAALIVVLAGGSEAEAPDLVAELPATGLPVVVIGSLADHRMTATLLQHGARDYFVLPGEIELLRRSLERQQREIAGLAEAERFANGERLSSGFGAILGRSATLRDTLDQAARVAAHDVTVLIQGETGTGKELLARAIHYNSPRAARPFVEINCAAIPAALLESELFGHEKGSFTGATAAKPGLFELGEGGTLFLDELASLPIELQPKLLRAIESRTIRRVGGLAGRQMDVRIVAATHVDLAAAVRRGEFREDLYYRLNVVMLTLPPLRDRMDDAELLAETFVQRIAAAYRLPVPVLEPEVRQALRAHDWPGNVRELRNAIERALVLSPPGSLRVEEMRTRRAPATAPAGGLTFPTDLRSLIAAAARAMLELTGGNKTEAARRLGISRPRLHRLLGGSLDDTE